MSSLYTFNAFAFTVMPACTIGHICVTLNYVALTFTSIAHSALFCCCPVVLSTLHCFCLRINTGTNVMNVCALSVNPDERVFIVLSCSFYQWCDSIFLPIFNWYPCVLFLEVLVHRSFIIRRGVLVVVPVLYYASVYTAMTFDLYNFVYIAFNDIYMSLEVHEATKLPLKLCNHCLHVSTVIIHVVLKGQCCNKQ